MTKVRRWSIGAATLIAIAPACGGEWFATGPYKDPCPPGAEVSPSRLEIANRSVTLRIGESAQASAEPMAAAGGSEVCPFPLVWTSSDVAVASVGIAFFSTAVIIAVGDGNAWVRVRSGTVSDSVRVTVSSPTVSLVTIGAPQGLLVGQSAQAGVIATDSLGNSLSGWTVTYSTSDATRATVSQKGVVVAVGEGSVRISADVEGVVGSTLVVVTRDAPATKVKSISAGSNHTCAIVGGGNVPDGSVACWGAGFAGQLGAGDDPQKSAPRLVSSGTSFASVDAGGAHTCALTAAGEAYCWGANFLGQVGDGTPVTTRVMPVKVATSVKFTSIAAGEFHTCALSTDGSAYCWGKMKERTSLVPVRVDGMPKLKQVTSEYGMACGLTEPGAAYCWGETEVIGKFVTRAQPALIPGGVVFASIAAGGYHSCGLTTQGAAWCWGFNQVGQIGAAPDPVTQAFALPGGLQFASIAAGGHFTCGLTSAGARCIGGARLPGSDVIPRAFVPIPRESEHPFVALSGGGFHACAIDTKGGAWCWGGNAQNQVTLGDDIEISEPRQVRID